MASAKDLRKRITSVKNTQQITKAMKMVSAAKLRRAQENMAAIRPYSTEIKKVISDLALQLRGNPPHPLLAERILDDANAKKKILVLLISSDRGLCGAFNTNVLKVAQRFYKEATTSGKYSKVEFSFIGKKGFEFFKNRQITGKYYEGFMAGLSFAKCNTLARGLIEQYLAGEYDEIRIIYNEFKSALSIQVNNDAFLPLDPPSATSAVETGEILFEPTPTEILAKLLPQHLAVQVYRCCAESLTSELAARMTAMDSATRNAGEMIKKITLVYNKTRQAGITKELLEIISGSEAQKA